MFQAFQKRNFKQRTRSNNLQSASAFSSLFNDKQVVLGHHQ